MNKKNIFIIVICSIVGLTIGVIAIIFTIQGLGDLFRPMDRYSIDSIDEYGIFEGNYDTGAVEEQFFNLFPSKIEENFSDVTYSFRAIGWFDPKGHYAYEAYLEFKVENREDFLNLVSKYTYGAEAKEFYYDNTYTEYSFADDLKIFVTGRSEDGKYRPSDVCFDIAKCMKVLVSENEQKIIFWALRVCGFSISYDFANVFFYRFQIDPFEYCDRVRYLFKK